jgi:transcriptional regulator with XRE-family HTH domain
MRTNTSTTSKPSQALADLVDKGRGSSTIAGRMAMKKSRETRQDPRWPLAHVALKRLYEDRIRDSLSQEEFGREYGIGTQGMVWQYLNGYTPLNIEVAWKFAEGLRCTIKDISPQMDDVIRDRLLPALGLKSWRRVAALALLTLILPQIVPDASAAQGTIRDAKPGCVLCKMLRRLKRECIHVLTKIIRPVIVPA